MDQSDFMTRLLESARRSVEVRILQLLPADVRPELLKKMQGLTPTVKWSGENNIKLFNNWLHSWLAYMSSCGWKGEAYNEFHVHALSTSVEGEALDLLMHYIRMGVQGGETPP